MVIGRVGGLTIIGVLASSVFCFGSMLSSSTVSADDVVDNVSITVPVACTMSGSGMTSHSASPQNGTYTANIGTTSAKVTCNDNAGFSIYAIGYTGNVEGGDNSTKLVGTNASGNSTIVTGTATSGSTSNWAMKLATSSGATYPITITNDFDSFHEVPANYTMVATRLSGTDVGTNATGANFTTTYAAYVSTTQAADTYTGKVKYVLVHPNDEAKPTVYSYIQELEPEDCTTSPQMVTDLRDNEDYMIQRLDDGNCWMLDNLRLDPTSVSLSALQGNTNASNQTLDYLKNGGGSSQYPADGVSDDWEEDLYDQPLVVADLKDEIVTSYGEGSGKIGVYYNYCAATAGSYCYAEGDGDGDSYEDLCPAGWRMPTSGEYDSTAYLESGEYFNLGDDMGLTFDEQYGGFLGVDYQTALSVPLSGVVWNGAPDDLDLGGAFWSSTGYDDQVYYFWGESDIAIPSSLLLDRPVGASIRCIMDAKETHSYMQDYEFGTWDLWQELPNVGDSKVLTDIRDGENYTVAHLADGNIWMLDNLRLDPTKVPLENLEGNTNVRYDYVLEYLKNGGGSNGTPAYGVSRLWDDSYDIPYVNVSSKNTIVDSFGDGSGKVGVYYNYCAASAGTYCYAENVNPGGGSYITEDLCPSGWTMAMGGGYDNASHQGSGEYFRLGSQLGLTFDEDDWSFSGDDYLDALSTPLSGSFYSGLADGQDEYGMFWSNTKKNNNNMHILFVDPDYVYPTLETPRDTGLPIRCVHGWRWV